MVEVMSSPPTATALPLINVQQNVNHLPTPEEGHSDREQKSVLFEELQHLSLWVSDDADDAASSDCEKENVIREILSEYDIERTARTISDYAQRADSPSNKDESSLFHVALQFPDDRLPVCPLVAQLLDTCVNLLACGKRSFFVYVLGDTSYNECCVDEVNAKHLDTDLIVHFGVACMVPVKALPVLFVLPRADVTSNHCLLALCSHLSDVISQHSVKEKESNVVDDANKLKKIVVLYDLDLAHVFEESEKGDTSVQISFPSDLQSYADHIKLEVAQLKVNNHYDVQLPPNQKRVQSNDESETVAHDVQTDVDEQVVSHLRYHTSADRNIGVSNIHFVWLTGLPDCDFLLRASTGTLGDDESYAAKVLRNSILSLTTGPRRSLQVSVMSAATHEVASDVIADTVLRRRFATLQRIEGAQRIGILVNAVRTGDHAILIDRVLQAIEAAHKYAYILVVGKLNEAKLANFADIDAFVLVSCAQNHLLPRSLTKNVMQPIVTPHEILCALTEDVDLFSQPYSNDASAPQISQVAGESSALVPKDGSQWSVANVRAEQGVLSAGEFMEQKRSWKGLSYDKGGEDDSFNIEDLSLTIEEGQHGIASGYDRERDDR